MRAAQYFRMSTEHQQYSIENQKAAIAEYAEQHGFQVVRTYSDPAKSGLTLRGRPGLRLLLQDVVSGNSDFHAVLVYDVTRWGRFQDVDESAYYEFLCKRAGVRVIYCAEPFDSSEGSTMTALFKSLKRAMAGEYLRELSLKVFVGQQRIASMGYKLGAAAGYGLRRELVSREGVPKGILRHHEWKSLSSDRVRYVLGPPEEVAVVRQIFQWFVNEQLWAPQIVKRLNDLGIPRERGLSWTQTVVIEMLKHPKYMGTMVYNRISKKLGANQTRNPCSKYLLVPNALPAIVTPATFQAAQRRLLPPRDLSDQELLDGLRRVLEQKGRLTARIIDSCPEVPGAQTYQRRFGNLGTVYNLIGYSGCDRLTSLGQGAHFLRQLRSRVERELCLALRELGCGCTADGKYLDLQGIGLFRLVLAPALKKYGRWHGWQIHILDQPVTPNLIAVRISQDYLTILDYLLLRLPSGHRHLLIDGEKATNASIGGTIPEAAETLSRMRLAGKEPWSVAVV